MNTGPSLECVGVSFAYPQGAGPVLQDVSFEIGPGITGLIGANGAGKSTLLRLLADFQTPTRGTIICGGAPVRAWRREGRIAMLPEAPVLDPSLTVQLFLEGIAALHETVFDIDAVSDIAGMRLRSLSLGQRRRVELACALIGKPTLILLDEPTNGLDPIAVRELRARLEQVNDGTRIIMVSSHHLDELQRLTECIIGLSAGRIAGCWTTREAVTQFGSIEQLFHATSTRSEVPLC